MKALVFSSVKEPLQLQDMDSVSPGADEVLVKVSGCGVCHTDIGFWQEGVPTKHELPLVLGHEISGIVEQAGDNYKSLVGKEVIIPAVIPCGDCDLCTSGRSNICQAQLMPGNDIHGGFADYITVPGRGLCVVEERGDYDLDELSVVADAVTTPYQAVIRSGLQEGDLAIVIGVGGVGGYCAQIASALGARVIAIDVDADTLATIQEYGASAGLNSAELDFRSLKKTVRALAGEWGCASHGWKIFECSGHPSGQATAFGLLNTAATLIVVGFTLDKIELRLSNLMAMDATVQGTWGCKPELYAPALKLVTDGKVKVKPFIERHPLAEGAEWLQKVADHKVRKRVILVP